MAVSGPWRPLFSASLVMNWSRTHGPNALLKAPEQPDDRHQLVTRTALGRSQAGPTPFGAKAGCSDLRRRNPQPAGAGAPGCPLSHSPRANVGDHQFTDPADRPRTSKHIRVRGHRVPQIGNSRCIDQTVRLCRHRRRARSRGTGHPAVTTSTSCPWTPLRRGPSRVHQVRPFWLEAAPRRCP